MYQVSVELPENARDWCERKGFEPVKRYKNHESAAGYFTMMRQLTPEGTRVSFDVI